MPKQHIDLNILMEISRLKTMDCHNLKDINK